MESRRRAGSSTCVLTELCMSHEKEIERLRIAEQDLARLRKIRANDMNEIARLAGLLETAGIK